MSVFLFYPYRIRVVCILLQQRLEDTNEILGILAVYKVLRMELYAPNFWIVNFLNCLNTSVFRICCSLEARSNILHCLVVETVYCNFLNAHLFVQLRILVNGNAVCTKAARSIL